jgi:hypothetical protein
MTALTIILYAALALAALLFYMLVWWWGFQYGMNEAAKFELKQRGLWDGEISPDVLKEIEKTRALYKMLRPTPVKRGKSALEEMREDPTYRANMEAQRTQGNGKPRP